MKLFCNSCSKGICCICLVTEHQFHNVVLLDEAVEAARADASELCVEASIFEEEIVVELQKLEQKSQESVDRSVSLHMKIDQEADALISRIRCNDIKNPLCIWELIKKQMQ